VTDKHLAVTIFDQTTGKPMPFGLTKGIKPEVEDYDDPNEDDEWKETKSDAVFEHYLDVVFVAEEVTTCQVNVSLCGKVRLPGERGIFF
jgi:hypothetical protein